MRVTSMKYRPNELSGAALAASRQMWLAGLGAAVISRDWIQNEAGSTFKALVKEGTVVESKAIRFLGVRLESSMTRANALWRSTRSAVQSTVQHAADSAVLFVKDTLPRSLPKVELSAPGAAAPKRASVRKPRAKRAAAKKTTRRAAKRTQRTA